MRTLLLLPALSGCFLLPWAGEIKDKAEQVGESISQAGAHPTPKAYDHVCACAEHDPDDPPTRMYEPCDDNGKYDPEGANLCCSACHKVCGKKPYTAPAKRKPSPVPVPLPPDCDFADHCRGKEACVIGDGKCCTKCKQACLELSE